MDLSPPDILTGCDVVETIGAAVDALLPLARRRGMTIRARLPARAYAAIDGDACMHALLNLLENAVKYGRDDGSVAIGCDLKDDRITITVDDDGPGVPAGREEAIFRLGVRGANERPGSGIGLAVVKALVDRSGGNVRLARRRSAARALSPNYPRIQAYDRTHSSLAKAELSERMA